MQVPMIDIKNLTVAYGTKLIQQNLTFSVNRKDIFVIMGGSGCGTLLAVPNRGPSGDSVLGAFALPHARGKVEGRNRASIAGRDGPHREVETATWSESRSKRRSGRRSPASDLGPG